MAKSGLTRYHTWGLLVPLLAAISPMLLTKYAAVDGVHVAFNALLAGALVAVVAYVLMTAVPFLKEESNALSKAVLCGLLVSEIMVLDPATKVPAMASITLYLFFYYHTVEHA